MGASPRGEEEHRQARSSHGRRDQKVQGPNRHLGQTHRRCRSQATPANPQGLRLQPRKEAPERRKECGGRCVDAIVEWVRFCRQLSLRCKYPPSRLLQGTTTTNTEIVRPIDRLLPPRRQQEALVRNPTSRNPQHPRSRQAPHKVYPGRHPSLQLPRNLPQCRPRRLPDNNHKPARAGRRPQEER